MASGRHMPRHKRGKNSMVRIKSLGVMDFHMVATLWIQLSDFSRTQGISSADET